MTKNTHMTRGARYGVAALLLLGTSAAAIAQQTTTPAAGNAMVNADTATHRADLTGAGQGTAWFFVDEQNNSVRWTIEYTGVEGTGATIMCPTDADPAAGAPAADAGMATTGGLTGQITRIDRAGGAAPAGADAGGGMPPAAPAAGADAGAGMTPAAPAVGAGADAGAGMTPAAPAAGEAGAMAGAEGMGQVVNLLDEGGTMTSPLEGQTADLDEATFQHISAGACFLEITVAATGGAGADAATPATPDMPAAVPPTP